jgi:hypothetical protein
MATPAPAPEPLLPEIRPPATIALPTGFQIGPVKIDTTTVTPPTPTLGPLSAFVGNWSGSGFNTIFRPDSTKTPTKLPTPVPPGPLPADNILELNLTTENLSFSASLGAVPNRGSGTQGDIFLNGVPYLQAINDVTTGKSIGIHLEPGMWVVVQPTNIPAESQTLARMASIPHGTTIQAQGTSTIINGPPTIPSVDITPFFTATGVKQPFPSQNATNKVTLRIPQDLTSFIAAGTITQAMLTDPNTVLRNHISGQKIVSTTQISVSTSPTAPLIGGGTDNIGFLDKNAQSAKMTATFWIETVQHTIVVPVFKVGQAPLQIKGVAAAPGQRVPVFSVTPPFNLTAPRSITVTSTQIQYSQTVLLNFNTLSWPHVSVATLVPDAAIVVPPSVWA